MKGSYGTYDPIFVEIDWEGSVHLDLVDGDHRLGCVPVVREHDVGDDGEQDEGDDGEETS